MSRGLPTEAPPAGQPIGDARRLSLREQAAIVAFAGLVLSLILYAPVLGAFFIWDDLSMLRWHSPLGGAGFASILDPFGNGFRRPIPLALIWLTAWIFGPEPIVFHLLPIVFHALNAGLLFFLARDRGMGLRPAVLVSLLFTAHFAFFPAVSMMQNIMDVMMGTAALGMLLAARHRDGEFPAFCISAVFIAALLCKETAIFLPVAGTLWWLATGGRVGRLVPGVFWPGGLTLIASIWLAVQQVVHSASYTSTGRIEVSPLKNLRHLSDYLISAVFPYIHVVEMPGFGTSSAHAVLLIMLLALCILVAGLIVSAVSSFRGPAAAVCAGGAVLLLFPAGCFDIHTPPQGRFLYAPATLLIVAGSELFMSLRGGGEILRRSAGRSVSLRIIGVLLRITVREGLPASERQR